MNMQPTVLPLGEDMKAMVTEIQSPFNQWVTGEEVGHEPTHNECAVHYLNHGGLAHFRQIHQIASAPIAA